MSLSTLEAELRGDRRTPYQEPAVLYENPEYWEGTMPPSEEVKQELVRRALQLREIDSLSLEEEAVLRDTLAEMETARLVKTAVSRARSHPNFN